MPLVTARLAPPRSSSARGSVAAQAKSKGPEPSRGPGQAPLRMQTDEQRKGGYGGDGCACAQSHAAPCTCRRLTRARYSRADDGGRGGGGGGDDGGMWSPGGSGDGVNPVGLGILGVCGLWAYWEYKRPGGKLAPKPKRGRYAQ